MAGGTTHPVAAPERARDPRARCRSARGSRRRAGSSGASPSRPARAATRAHSATCRSRATAAPRSAWVCKHAGGVRSSGGRTAPGRPRRPGRRSARRRCSRERGRSASGREGRCSRASSARSHRSWDTPAQRRPGRRTTPPAPSETPPGCARPPARRPDPARSSSPRARRSARPFRSQSRQRRGALPTSGDGPGRRRGRRRRASRSCGGLPAPVAGRLRAVPADRHRAPVGGSVARLVVEDPPARVLAARLEPRPRSRLRRGNRDRGEGRERPVDALPCRSEGRNAVVPDREPERERAEVAQRCRCGGRLRRPARGVGKRERPQARPQRAGPEERVGGCGCCTPGSSSPRSASQADRAAGEPRSSWAHSGISVLTKSCRRSRGAGAGARPAGWNPVMPPRYGLVVGVSTPPNTSRRCH